MTALVWMTLTWAVIWRISAEQLKKTRCVPLNLIRWLSAPLHLSKYLEQASSKTLPLLTRVEETLEKKMRQKVDPADGDRAKNYIVERGKNLWTKNIEMLSEYMNKAALCEQQPKQMISIWSEDSVQPRSHGELNRWIRWPAGAKRFNPARAGKSLSMV